MSGQQQLVGAAAVGLVVANVWNSPQWNALSAVVSGDGPTADTHNAVKQVGLQLLGAGALTLAAGTSGKAANISALIVVCLWVLWFLHHGSHNGVMAMTGAAAVRGARSAEANPFRVPGTVSPPVNTGPPIGRGPMNNNQTPGLPPVR